MKFLSLENKWFVWTTFLLLFFYLILRAIFITPYCDEVATLFEYIEAPFLFEPVVKDSSANNHLLNTLLGKFVYLFFGDTISFLRIPNILAFILYFFSIKYVVLKSVIPRFQVLTFVALNTVAWIFEYFSYLRGYGLALGLLFCSITLFYSWTQNRAAYKLFLFIALLWLSVFANLSFFNTSVILWLYAIIYIFLNFKDFNRKQIVFFICVNVAYLLALLPLINYSFELKEAGALWWGNLAGIWLCTGVSLSMITFFDCNSTIEYSILTSVILIGILGLKRLKDLGLKEFISSLEGLFFTLFIGNIVMIELLATFFEVNYPRDRAAVQLVLCLIITFILFVQKIRFVSYLSWVLLFFPITFLFHISLKTSIYQTDHRLSREVLAYLQKNVTDQSSYSLCQLIDNTAYLELRNNKRMKLFGLEKQDSLVEPNFMVVESNVLPPLFYHLKMEDKISNISIYQDSRKRDCKLVKDTLITNFKSANDVLLFRLNGLDTLCNMNKFKVCVSSKLKFLENGTPMNLILALGDSIDPNRYYNSIELKKLSKNRKKINILWNSPIYSMQENRRNLSLFFWNMEVHPVEYSYIRVKIYRVLEENSKLK